MAYEYLGSFLKSESIKSDACYFGNISRESAETVLNQRAKREGTYLVREGNDGFRLSVVESKSGKRLEIVHFKVQLNCNKAFSIDPECSFTSMTSLITYYKGRCTNMRQPLTDPCPSSSSEKLEENLHGSTTDTSLLSVKEISKSDITFKTQLHVGKYTEIWKAAALQNPDQNVTVKVSNDEPNSDWYLIEEARALGLLQHPNIAEIVGLSRDHSVHLLYGYYGNGDLLDFLLRKNVYEISKFERLRFAQEVSEALLHLSKLNYVHRNVRACNILVTHDLTCKLGGFGYVAKLNQSGNYIECQNDKPFNPNCIRWMAVECAVTKQFSTASDIWSLACLIVEIFTDGEAPYSGTLTPNVLKIMQAGYRPPMPSFLPESLYALMVKCWNPEPKQRPGHAEIQQHLCELRNPEPTKKLKKNLSLDLPSSKSQPSAEKPKSNHSFSYFKKLKSPDKKKKK